MDYPDWATDTSQRVEPTSPQKVSGFAPNFRPPAQWHNYLFGILSDWIRWLDLITQLNNSQNEFDAVVGTNGTHATINILMADPNISNITKVLVTTPQTLTATQVINKSDIEFVFKPSAVYSKGLTTTPGISIQAQRVKIMGGRFTSFNGVSDVAIQIETTRKNNWITNGSFVNNTTDINDLGSNNVLANNIVEL